jgi:hypothetical protein
MLQVVNRDSFHFFELSKTESINLELCLNVTKYAYLWKYIGDFLFDYGTDKLGENVKLPVTSEQYEFLKLLITKDSWRDCMDL